MNFWNKIVDKWKNITIWVTVMKYIIVALVPVVAFYLMEFYEHNPFIEVREKAQYLNIILFELIAWFLFFVIGSARAALRTELVLAMVFGLINHYVMAFRSTPFVPWDILSVRTAASVASEYDFTPTRRVVIVTLLFLALIGLLQFLKLKPKMRWQFRLTGGIVLFVGLWTFTGLLQDDDFQNRSYLYPFLFTPVYMTKVNGMAVTFAMNLEYIVIERPAGYSVEKAEAILREYEEGPSAVPDGYPNIIVIMDEAFSDMAVVGDFKPSEDYMPFVHSLQQGAENTVTGYAEVSVCGGNTANSEFEFLTGNTMAFLPVGSIPYQQYIKSECPSMASYLKSLGYETYGQHPYNATGWSRNTVYPLLGLDNNIFLKDYDYRKYLRDYQSDWADFMQIIYTYENHESDKPMFLFNVTMQNHGGYTEKYDNFTPDITVSGISSEVVSTYLSLIKKTDESVQMLVDYFAKVDEKTMIVFFGDHQPNTAVSSPIFRYNGVDPNNLTEEQRLSRYVVPYFIWANYDIEEETNCNLSLNYLGTTVLKKAGVPTSTYMNFLEAVQEKYASITANRIAGSDDAGEEAKDILQDYKIVQYYYLFDWKE